MRQPLTIALDAMGGDNAPAMVLKGAETALLRFPDLRLLIFGSESQVRPLLERLPKVKAAAELIHAEDVVAADAKPSAALRSGRRSSMRLAIDAVAQGRADCDADNLVQFAVLGDAFARAGLGLTRPLIGILNIGSEEVKGIDAVREAAHRLRAGEAGLNFHGFVEGNDIPLGTVDVVVTDGFSGNIALKTAEGVVKLFSNFLRNAIRSSLMARLGYLFVRPALNRLRERIDPRRYNGAMLVGLNGIVVKSHGGSDAFGFANAISVAADLKINGLIERIRAELKTLRPADVALPALPDPVLEAEAATAGSSPAR